MIKFNEVTWYSKLAAVIFFIGVLPVLTFYIGVQYQKTNSLLIPKTAESPILGTNTNQNSESNNQIEYEMIIINNFNIPQVRGFENKDVMEKVNSYFLELAQNSKCEDGLPRSENNYYELKTDVSYAQNDIFSTEIRSSYFCSSAYPTNNSNDSITFDMRSGEIVKYEDLFTNYERDKKAILSLVFEKQIQEDKQKELSKSESDSTLCGGYYSQPTSLIDQKYDGPSNYFNYISFNISKNGLSTQPDFPHAIAACSEVGTASIESLKPYFGSSSILSRVK